MRLTSAKFEEAGEVAYVSKYSKTSIQRSRTERVLAYNALQQWWQLRFFLSIAICEIFFGREDAIIFAGKGRGV